MNLSNFLLICNFLITSFNTYLIFCGTTKLNKSKQSQVTDEIVNKNELTAYELERLEREEEFDERINRLKEELSNQQQIIRKGVSADELHPLVHNLPHDIIQNKYDVLPDVEVAD